MVFSIYCLKNIVNEKVYIGQTSRGLDVRFQEHKHDSRRGKKGCKKLYAAIRKYGENNFTIEKLHETDSIFEANELEQKYIKDWDSIKSGYNIAEGGRNSIPTEETRKLLSISHKGPRNYMFGKTHSPEARAKISKAKTGSSGFWKGKNLPDSIKEKISKSRKGKTYGDKNPGAKLTWDQVDQIRYLFRTTNLTREQVAEQFNISLSAIKRIKANTHWKVTSSSGNTCRTI